MEDNQIYNAIESPSAEPEQHQATPKTKAKRLKSGGKGKKKSVEVGSSKERFFVLRKGFCKAFVERKCFYWGLRTFSRQNF